MDLAPVAWVGSVPLVLVVAPGRGLDSTAAIVAAAKARSLSFASSGNGTVGHMVGEMWKRAAGIDLLHVPYKGGGPAMTAVLGNETQLHFPAPAVGIPHVKAGRVRALGFTGPKRLAALPDVPTIGETVTGYYADAGWHGVFAPAKTPPEIVKKVQEAIYRALQAPHVRDHFVNGGYEPQGSTPAEWGKRFRTGLKRYAEITRIAKIEPQ